MNAEEAKKIVRQRYATIAKQSGCCCSPATSSCCGDEADNNDSRHIGYSEEDINSIPDGANLGLGCGNPIALASLKDGETVLDLGSGGGIDCFLAANRVGEKGKVIGVDMTPAMITKARANARRGNYKNVEFRFGEIENLPVEDNSVDVIISNCVINLVPDKKKAFAEAYRVLRPGGRLMVSDIVLLKDLPASVRESADAYSHCVAGASKRDDYLGAIRKAGFVDVKTLDEKQYSLRWLDESIIGDVAESLGITEDDIKEAGDCVLSVKACGLKPK